MIRNSEDYRHRGEILRTLLMGSVILSSIAFLVIMVTPLFTQHEAEMAGVHGTFIVFGLFLILYFLQARGATRLASALFCLVYLATGTFMVLTWGILLPLSLLLFALATISANILINSTAGFLTCFLTAVILGGTEYLHMHHILTPDISWASRIGGWSDVIVFVSTLSILMITAWLSSREIERSFRRASAAERELKKERDTLELRVEQRTQELRETQRDELQQLYEFAYFGRITSTLLHDVANPLSTIAMALRRLDGEASSTLIKRALENTKRIEGFVKEAREQLRHRRNVISFQLAHETEQIVAMLDEELAKYKIQFELACVQDAISADPVRYDRLVTNLLSNAIDACKAKRGKRVINLSVQRYAGGFALTVQDNGAGISTGNLKRIFEPFFTTKDQGKGQGLGLSICKEIVEQDFKGEIVVTSKRGNGTTVTAYLFTSAP